MNVLVLGSGGREHAIVKALKNSVSVDQIHAIPGREAWQEDCVCADLSLQDSEALSKYAKERNIQLVVIGPEDPLAQGLADDLRAQGLLVFGPSGPAAQLEGSKIFAKQFMEKAKVPTAKFSVVDSVEQTLKSSEGFTPPYVLKADGLAAGKGVFICQDKDELGAAAKALFVGKIFGEAGEKALLEQFQPGWETSVFVLTNGEDYTLMPFSQDHKRLLEGDKGPNTGGMGVVAPLNIEGSLVQKIETQIVQPSVKGLKDQGLNYWGVLYIGLMVTPEGPRVIEYNVRFGDPEAQVLLPLLNGDWGEVFLQIAQGQVKDLNWKSLSSACVVLAAENYPENPVKGVAIEGEVFFTTPSSYFLHAGTKKDQNWVTAGGRVLNAIGIGSNLQEALSHAYEQADKVDWKNLQRRNDIGQKVL